MLHSAFSPCYMLPHTQTAEKSSQQDVWRVGNSCQQLGATAWLRPAGHMSHIIPCAERSGMHSAQYAAWSPRFDALAWNKRYY